VAASGAADPEQLADARSNAPRTVLTLDRIVSLHDFENFARAFAGIGKAQAASIWDGERNLVHITLADASGDPVPVSSMQNLRDAIDAAREPDVALLLDTYELLTFFIEASVRYDAAYLAEKIQPAVEDALKAAFSFAQRSFGQPVTAAEIISTVHQVTGVVAIDLDALHISTPTARPGVPAGSGQPASKTESTPAAVLPARSARREAGKVLPAQLLLLDEAGMHVTLQAV
jgi:hypothetical protein